jgi:glycosyltransferase involved in cell wall biosynthesis
MDRSRVAIVIPALNEAATIERIVHSASKWGTCIVVNDGSTDATGELAREAGAMVVLHPENRGYDAALDTGFRRAAEEGFDVIVTLDADGQHDPGLVRRFLEALHASADLVLGVRSRRARIAEHLFACYTFARWGIRDPLCGLKAYRTKVFRELGHFDSYGSVGTELALFAARRGMHIEQVPFEVRQREDQPRFGRRFSANYRIMRSLALSLLVRPRSTS